MDESTREKLRAAAKRYWTPERRAEASARAAASWTPARRAEQAFRLRAAVAKRMAEAPIGAFSLDAVQPGEEFGLLTIAGPYDPNYAGPRDARYWICKCKCGRLCARTAKYLVWGKAKRKSCGCAKLAMMQKSVAVAQARLEHTLSEMAQTDAEQDDLASRLP